MNEWDDTASEANERDAKLQMFDELRDSSRESYYKRIASIQPVADHSTAYFAGYRDARYLAAEIAAEADAEITTLTAQLDKVKAELRDWIENRGPKLAAEVESARNAELLARLAEADANGNALREMLRGYFNMAIEDIPTAVQGLINLTIYNAERALDSHTSYVEAKKRATAAEARAEAAEKKAEGWRKESESHRARATHLENSCDRYEADAGRLREALREYADTANWYVDRESGPAHYGWLGSDPTAIAQLALSPAEQAESEAK